MTTKEKAEELVNKMFLSIVDRKTERNLQMYWSEAKKCAIMCCDELISEHTFKNPIKWNLRQVRYWQQVKTEIEKL